MVALGVLALAVAGGLARALLRIGDPAARPAIHSQSVWIDAAPAGKILRLPDRPPEQHGELRRRLLAELERVLRDRLRRKSEDGPLRGRSSSPRRPPHGDAVEDDSK